MFLGNKSKVQGMNLSGSRLRGHSTVNNTPTLIRVVCKGSILVHAFFDKRRLTSRTFPSPRSRSTPYGARALGPIRELGRDARG